MQLYPSASLLPPPLQTKPGDCFNGQDEASATLVTREQVVQACGELGHALKPYQLVGINFLMLLNKVQSANELSHSRGAILADEMGECLALIIRLNIIFQHVTCKSIGIFNS